MDFGGEDSTLSAVQIPLISPLVVEGPFAADAPLGPIRPRPPSPKSDVSTVVSLPSGSQSVDALARLIVGNGRLDAVLIRGALPYEYCIGVAERFDGDAQATERADGVPGRELGATQYGKAPDHYLEIAYGRAGSLEKILGGAGNPIRHLLRTLADAFAARGYKMRPAIWRGEAAPTGRITNWGGDGDDKYLLHLHDDWAQIKARHNADFEVTRVQRLFALNIYLRSTPGSGQLEVWNWRPSDMDRQKLKIVSTGYPVGEGDIPPHCSPTTMDLRAGDIACIDGALLHGVLVGEGNVADRLLMNIFLGVLDDEVLIWA